MVAVVLKGGGGGGGGAGMAMGGRGDGVRICFTERWIGWIEGVER